MQLLEEQELYDRPSPLPGPPQSGGRPPNWLALWLATVAALVLVSAGSYVAGARGMFPALYERVTAGTGLARARQVEGLIEGRSVLKAAPAALEEGAIAGMVKATGDRWADYFTPEQYQGFQQAFSSTFGGIGVTVSGASGPGPLTISDVIKGGPAEKAGVKPGDVILTAAGQDLVPLSLDQSMQLLRGEIGTSVTITVRRAGTAESLAFTLTRATVEQPSVQTLMVEPGTGLLRVFAFQTKTGRQVVDAVADLRKQGAQRLILDLRHNPGGYVDQAVQAASAFLPEKALVLQEFYADGRKVDYRAQAQAGGVWNRPLVVLIDSQTASAAEILGGALKDAGVAKFVGNATFGKGLAQQIYPLPWGSVLKLSTIKWLTPKGRSIQDVGVQPDEVANLAEGARFGDAGDTQVQAALKLLHAGP